MLGRRFPERWRPRAFPRPGTLSRRATLTSIGAIWCVALLLSGLVIPLRYGDWGPVLPGLIAAPVFAFFTLPGGLLMALGQEPVGLGLGIPMLLFWLVMVPLHVAALVTRHPRYLVAIAALLAPAAWNWVLFAAAITA